MTSLSFAVRDSVTMFRRDLRRSRRYPMIALSGVFVPVFFLVLFVGVFGKTLRTGVGASLGLGEHYVNYLTPGILLMTAAAAAEATAINVCTDMGEGIINRFRTLAVSRVSVLTGQVLGSLLRTLISGLLIVGVTLAFGFRSPASPSAWLAAAGTLAAVTLAVTWLGVAFGLFAKTPGGANSL
jgi:ABC-2 type transport system permease protein